MTDDAAGLTDEQIDAEIQRLLSDPAEIRAMALRVRALENDVRHRKQTAEKWKRLHDDRCEKAAAAEKRAEASAKDAGRYQIIRYTLSAERIRGMCRFILPEWLTKKRHTDFMKGSVAGHLDDVCDAAMTAKEQKRG